MNIAFAKMHGLGNDFMIVNRIEQDFDLPAANQINLWSDRRTGIGFDQMLVIEAPERPDCDFHYRIFNADGREAAHCGNGARCIARYLLGRLTDRTRLSFSTGVGRIATELRPDGSVRVQMGTPEVFPPNPPEVIIQGQPRNSPQLRAGVAEAVALVKLGNLHWIVPVDDLDDDEDLQRQDQSLREDLDLWLCNINFVRTVNAATLRLVTFEAGVDGGRTPACGSGACASAAAMIRTGTAEFPDIQTDLTVMMDGGSAEVSWPERAEIYLSGPAECVYEGTVRLP
ncbi:MAG: diaminopimelate epimerase [Gammaproteobacteria bacterium AqS3]|nr:diaminopimelate epimerase [Gammaproteobacteria bacterium AqS3]